MLQIGLATVNRDITYLRSQAKTNIKKYIDERLPEEYEKCLVGLTAITKEAWNTSQQTEDKREKIQALSLAKDDLVSIIEIKSHKDNLYNAFRQVDKLDLADYIYVAIDKPVARWKNDHLGLLYVDLSEVSYTNA